jgi:N,N'-diacetyllegionaminate synthase
MIEIIAEVGSVHDGSLGNAKKLAYASKIAGANTVKFQLHIAEEETLLNAKSPNYFKDETRFEYFKRTAFSFSQWAELIKYCKEININFLCSPFSIEAINLLEKLKVTKYKIPSGEITNIPYIKRLAQTKKECILSTGMSNWKEIDTAVKYFAKKNLVIMQCSSIYPCPPNKVGLNVISEIKKRYKTKIGISDHTEGISASVASVVLGASVIEKHITFSKMMYGSDAKNAMEIDQFRVFCKELKDAEIMINSNINKNKINHLEGMRKTFMKSIVASKNLAKGTRIDQDDINMKKPGTGLPASYIDSIIGKRLTKNIKINTLLKKEHFK